MRRLNGSGERRLLGLHSVFEGFRINAKEDVPGFHEGVRFDRHLDHHPADGGNDRCGVKVEPRLTGEGVIVVHAQQQRPDQEDAAQRGREQREAVDWDLE